MNTVQDKSVTVIVRDQVRKSRLKDYEEWLKVVHEKLTSFRGFSGLEIVPPNENTATDQKENLEYHIIFRFDNYDNLQLWEKSNFLADQLNEASDFPHSQAHIQYVEGMELWYDLSDKLPRVGKPLYWKQVLVTIFTVYPLILGADLLLGLLFPMHKLNPKLAIFFSVIIVASLMVYPVMPFVTRHIGSWLHKK